MKIFLIAYMIFGGAAFVLEATMSDLLVTCKYNGEACTQMAATQAWHALTWPQYLLMI